MTEFAAPVPPLAATGWRSVAPEGSWQRDALLDIRATVMAGIWLGALVGGIGGRLAMLVLRVLSPDDVHGLISDDGFFIGRVTLSGTYSLIGIGAMFGIIGAAVFRWVDHWLLGPESFRRLTCALGGGAVIGAMLINSDGVDFTRLRPLELAIAFFVLIPALFAFFVGPLERALARPGAWTSRGRRMWLLPLLSIAWFPPMIVAVGLTSVVMLVWRAIRQTPSYDNVRDNGVFGLVIRGVYLGVALIGLATLVGKSMTILE